MECIKFKEGVQAMLKIVGLVWVMLGTVLAGVAVTTILTVPALSDQALKYIPIGAIGGFVVAIPFAIVVARRMSAGTKFV